MLETLNATKSIEVESDKAWRAIAFIGGLDRWFPIISSCRVAGDGVGSTRILTLKDGAEMRDRGLEIDSSARRFRYERTHCPFLVTKYLGTVEVRDDAGSRSSVSRTVQIEVVKGAREELVPLLKQALSDGIGGLEVELRQVLGLGSFGGVATREHVRAKSLHSRPNWNRLMTISSAGL